MPGLPARSDLDLSDNHWMPAFEPRLREVVLGDHDALVELWHRTGIDLPVDATLDELRAKLDRDADLFLVAEVGSQLAGSVMASFDGRRGWIGRLCVREEWQGQGLAALLVSTVESRLRGRGCSKVNLLVEPTNARAIDLYRHLGYKVDHLVFMEKWL